MTHDSNTNGLGLHLWWKNNIAKYAVHGRGATKLVSKKTNLGKLTILTGSRP